MLVYATPDDFAAWTQAAAPDGLGPLLRSASLAVAEATELCFYAVDSDGYPAEQAKRQAFTDATCQQVVAMLAAGLDGSGVVEADVETSAKIGTASVTFAAGDAALAAALKSQTVLGLTMDATRILRAAGVAPTAPWVVG